MTTSKANAINIKEGGFTFIVLAFPTHFTAQFYMKGDIMTYYNELLEDMTFATFEAAKAYCMKAIDMTLESAYCLKYDL